MLDEEIADVRETRLMVEVPGASYHMSIRCTSIRTHTDTHVRRQTCMHRVSIVHGRCYQFVARKCNDRRSLL